MFIALGILFSSQGLSAETGATLLDTIRDGDLNRVKALVDSGISVNYKDVRENRATTPLMTAARFGHLPIVEYLLQKGADVGLTNKDGRNALMIAVSMEGEFEGDKAEQQLTDVVKLLINKGINVDQQDSEGKTALMLAANAGWKNVVIQLLERGASPWLQSKDGKNLLSTSKLKNAREIDEILAKRMHVKTK